jgi:bifunctional non-homologous end joining protein LigD
VTPEPSGTTGEKASRSTQGRRFVVQRHRASSLHYDFRLEIGGVLASWAVPRGPTLDAGARRLAIRVEDHPLGYFDFEGVIPRRQYGAGDVIVWDWGTYHPDQTTPDAEQALAHGTFKFELRGEKLHGQFVLVRTAGFGRRRRVSSELELRQKWLLMHRRDAAASDGWDPEAWPRSVKSGRTNDEVARPRGRRAPGPPRADR